MSLLEALFEYATGVAQALMRLFTSPGSFLSPAPLLAGALIAAFVIMRRQRATNASLSLAGLARELFPARIWRHRSARNDIAIILINDGLLFFLMSLAAFVVEPLRSAAVNLLGVEANINQAARSDPLSMILFGVYFAIVWDFFVTFAHYLKHKTPFLWEFHKVHHCAEVLTPLTAMRRHPVEIFVSALVTTSGVALALTLWIRIAGAPGTSVEIGGTALLVYVWRLLGYNIRHSHVWISYGPFWNRYLMSPAHHQLHHSRDPRHHDCNFGHIFTCWDRLFGTLYEPVEGETFELGVEARENAKLRTLRGLYFRPLKQAFARVFAKPRVAARAE